MQQPSAYNEEQQVLRELPQQDFLLTGGREPEFLCNYCKKDISSTLRFKVRKCGGNVVVCVVVLGGGIVFCVCVF